MSLTSANSDAETARQMLTADDEWILPAHAHVETLRTIRRLVAHSHLSPDEASEAVEEVCAAEVITVPAEPWVLRAIWDLRHTVSPYDAGYIALAQRFECAVVTFDKRLARAASQLGVRAVVPTDGSSSAGA